MVQVSRREIFQTLKFMKKITARPLLTACVALLGGWVGVVGVTGIANAQVAVRSTPELKGILNWPGKKLALLSDTNGFKGAFA